jgi:hypothetical protein
MNDMPHFSELFESHLKANDGILLSKLAFPRVGANMLSNIAVQNSGL